MKIINVDNFTVACYDDNAHDKFIKFYYDLDHETRKISKFEMNDIFKSILHVMEVSQYIIHVGNTTNLKKGFGFIMECKNFIDYHRELLLQMDSIFTNKSITFSVVGDDGILALGCGRDREKEVTEINAHIYSIYGHFTIDEKYVFDGHNLTKGYNVTLKRSLEVIDAFVKTYNPLLNYTELREMLDKIEPRY